jgi:hypothetical protein
MLKYWGKFLGLVNKLATITNNVMGTSLSVYEFSPYEQLAWKELPVLHLWMVKGKQLILVCEMMQKNIYICLNY